MRRWQIGSGRSFKGRMFTIGGWWVWVNCHTRWSLLTHYRHTPNFGRPVRSLVILGCELSWGRR
jgi:hypothetical protein